MLLATKRSTSESHASGPEDSSVSSVGSESDRLAIKELLDSQLAEIEARAERGEWSETAALLKRLPQLVMQISPTERGPILMLARTRIEALRERVQDQTNSLRGQLGTLKTGQRAAASYRSTNAMGNHSG